MNKTLDTIISSIGYLALFLFASSISEFFVEYGRFLSWTQLLIYLMVTIVFSLIGRYIRKKNNLQPRHGVYILIGIIAIVIWYVISFSYALIMYI